MIKIFISHSSLQKDSFAKPIVSRIGANSCILDAYDFSPAFKTMDEIIEKLGKSSIFVFLASKASLSSKWCSTEIKRAKSAYDRGDLKLFLVYIVESDVTIDDLPDWISKEECFNLKYFRSPRLIANDINNKMRLLRWEQNSLDRFKENFYVGRNHEIEDFQYRMTRKPYCTTLVVSGRPGSGREEFGNYCLRSCKMAYYEFPEKISLERDQSIENFISQLNTITYLFTDQYLHDILIAPKSNKIDALVEQLNEVFSYGFISINDTRSIITDGGHPAPWFCDLLKHPNLKKELKTVIASSIKPRAYYEDDYEGLVTVNLEELNYKDRQIMLVEYVKRFGGAPLSNDDINYFLSKALYSPNQFKKIAEIIAREGISEAKKSLGAVEEKGRDLISKMLNDYKDREDVIQFLILMSQLESTRYEALSEIYEEEYGKVENLIPELIDSAIIINYGPSDTFLRIDSAVGDYISRSELKLKKSIREKLKKYVDNLVNSEIPSISEDLTTYMATLREGYKKGLVNVENILLPSEALRTIIKLYNEGKNDSYILVERLCKELLNKGHLINLNYDFQRNIIYWLCLTLAHLGHENDFFKYVRQLEGVQSDFLKGFWFRQNGIYDKAKVYYQKVLNNSTNVSKRRASTEMVIVMTKLKDFDGAFDLAHKLFEEDPSNAYYTSVLFRASINKSNWNVEQSLRERLIKNMRGLLVSNRDQYVAAMELYLKVKDFGTTREEKYREIASLKEKYKSKMIPYLQEAVDDCLLYLNK